MRIESLVKKYPSYEALFQEIQTRIDALGHVPEDMSAFAKKQVARIMPKSDQLEAIRRIQKYLEWKQTTI